MRMAGDISEATNDRGERVVSDTLYLLFNAHHDKILYAAGTGR